jgi:hypothetical protein
MEEPILPRYILDQIDRRWQALLARQAAQSKVHRPGLGPLKEMGRSAQKRRSSKPRRLESQRV